METSSNKSKGEAKESLSIPKSISKHLTPNKICTIMSIVAVIGLIISLSIGSGIPAMLFLLPSAIYQVIRTAGVSTKSASVVLLVSLAIELFLIIFNIQFDLGQYLGQDTLLIGNSSVPMGDARIVLPFIMVIAAIITPADVLSMLMAAFPLLLLYEFSIVMCSYTNKKVLKREMGLEKAK